MINIKINLKQLGGKRAKIAQSDFLLENAPTTVRELITSAVHTCVSAYNERVREGESAAKPLSDAEITAMSTIGKIAFGVNYGEHEQDKRQAAENALQSYEDGIVRIFIGDSETGGLDDPITLNENDTVTFIRLSMLSGRMW